MKKKKSDIELFTVNNDTQVVLPFSEGIKAGFPSPAQDYIHDVIDLNKELIRHPEATFYGRVTGDSMEDACIFEGDILVIDKSLEAKNNSLIICFIDGEFTLKYLKKEKDKVYLLPANKEYDPIMLTADNQVIIWGVVTYSIMNHIQIRKHH